MGTLNGFKGIWTKRYCSNKRIPQVRNEKQKVERKKFGGLLAQAHQIQTKKGEKIK